METRIGFGWDSHAFKAGIPLRVGGMTLEHPEGLAGHSDGDVLLHAITDALLGAVAAGDIGSFFPPGDPRWKDANSAIFLKLAMEELQNAGFRIVNVDTTLIMNAPKIAPIAGDMRSSVADLLGIEMEQVSIKAKTPEGLGLDHVAQCHAVVLVERSIEPDELKSMSAVIESQKQLEDVVDDLLASVHGVPKKRPINPGLRHRRHHVSAAHHCNRGKILSRTFESVNLYCRDAAQTRILAAYHWANERQTSVGRGHFPDARAAIGNKQEDIHARRGPVSWHGHRIRARDTPPATQSGAAPTDGASSPSSQLGRAGRPWIFERGVERPMEIPQRR